MSMLPKKHHPYVKLASADPLPANVLTGQPRSLYRKWNQMSRFQRKLILLIILVLYFVFLLVLQKYQAEIPKIVEDDVEGPRLVRISIKPFGKKEDQEENEEARKQLQTYLTNKQEKVKAMVIALAETLARVLEQRNHPELDTIPLTFKGPQNERQNAVVAAFKHAWDGYKRFAWGHDNLKPMSGGFYDWYHLGLTIVDSLDTLYIMNLTKDFDEAKNWVEQNLDLKKSSSVNFFEVTVRVLGGLLSAYRLSGEEVFLSKATELGNSLLPVFNTTSGIPYTFISLNNGYAQYANWMNGVETREVASFQLEFNYLSWASNSTKFEEMAEKVNHNMEKLKKKDGLAYSIIHSDGTGFDKQSTISVGKMVDSFYEYLLKQWIQTRNKSTDYLRDEYKEAVYGIIMHLTQSSPHQKYLFTGELKNGNEFIPMMDHLACFLPGTLLLGYANGMPDSHLHLAEGLLDTCYQMYMKQPTHLAPKRTYFNGTHSDIHVKPDDAYNMLRPEFVESLYYFYALTGKTKYQDMGWEIFTAIEKYAKVENGYSSMFNVLDTENTPKKDILETFFFSETLKYFYLLFSDNRREIDLDKFVFNTKAHPLPIRG